VSDDGLVTLHVGEEWQRAIEYLKALQAKLPLTLQQAVLQEAHFIRGEIIKGLDSGAPAGKKFKPHSDLTKFLRVEQKHGGTKILIGKNAGLRGGVRVVMLPGGGCFVGVHRSAKSKDGKSLIRIAQIHEEGRSWEPGPRQRKWLIMQMIRAGIPIKKKGSGTIMKITIPARPFISPILEAEATPEKIRGRMIERLQNML
jgi:hypothetical protein